VAKPTIAQWAKARAIFEAGKSYRDISKELKIPVSTLSDRARIEGWSKGILGQLIVDSVRVEADIRTLETEQQATVRAAISKQLEGMEFYATNARKIIKMGMHAYAQSPSESGMKTIIEGMKTGMQVEGLVPYYPNQPVINNTNAQQNNQEPQKIIFEVVK
jgi:hypothetical protein